jgi:hypothetical protein
VCISQTDGSVGDLVGRDVASELGFRYVDQEIVTRAAEKAHVDRATILDAERRKSFVRRLLDALSSSTLVLNDPMIAMHGPAFDLETPLPSAGDLDFRDVIRSVIGDLAEEGRVVIGSHAASVALAGTPHVLRVLVTASVAVRAERVSHGGQGLDPAAARAALREADRNRQDYFRRFYEIEREEPTHYDLVLSTDVLSEKAAVAIICAAARIAGS